MSPIGAVSSGMINAMQMKPPPGHPPPTQPAAQNAADSDGDIDGSTAASDATSSGKLINLLT